MPEKIEMMQAPETIMPLSETKRSVFSMKSHSSTKDSTSIRGTLKKMYEALKDSSEDTSPLKEILKSIKTM